MPRSPKSYSINLANASTEEDEVALRPQCMNKPMKFSNKLNSDVDDDLDNKFAINEMNVSRKIDKAVLLNTNTAVNYSDLNY